MTARGSHWNRSARKSGGDRKFKLDAPVLNGVARARMVIENTLRGNPSATIEECGRAAMLVATEAEVIEAMGDFVEGNL